MSMEPEDEVVENESPAPQTPKLSVQEHALDGLMARLDAFGMDKKVFNVTINNDIEDLLDLDRDKLKGMEADECGENAALLAKYAYYVQGLSNTESIALHFAEESLKKVVMANYKAAKGSQYMKYEEVEGLIVNSNDAAAEYNRLRVLAKARHLKFAYLANRIQFVAQTLIELQQSKRKSLRMPQ